MSTAAVTPDPSQQPQPLPPINGTSTSSALSSLFGSAHETAAQQEADFERNRQSDIAMYTQELLKPPIPGEDPTAAATRRQKIADQIGKLRNLNKGSNPLQNVATVLSAIHHHIATPGAAGLPPVTAPQAGNELDPAPPVQTNELGDALPAVHPAVTAPTPLPPISTGQKIKNLAANVGATLAHGAGAALNAASNVFVGSSPPSLPPIDASLMTQGGALPIKWDPHPSKGKDLADDVVERNGNPVAKDETLYATGMQGNKRVVQPFNANPSQMAPRSLGTTIALDDARQLESNGQPVMSPSGQQYDLTKIPANMKFQAVGLPGGKVAYVLGTEKQIERTNGNEHYIVNEFEQQDPSSYVATGVARVPSTHTGPGIVTDPVTGEQSIGTTSTTTSPTTVGMSGAGHSGLPTQTPGAQIGGGAGAPATGPVNLSPVGAGTPQPTSKGLSPIKSPSGAPVASPTFSGQPKAAPGIPFAAANTLNQRLVPVREAATSLFGDPETGISPLASFAHIASNPDSAKKVGTAVKLTLDGMEPEARGGGVWQAIQDESGFTAFKQGAANKTVGDQLAQMTPEERQSYDALLTAYSTAIGLRTLTRASAAQFSVKALENEIPIPGYNSSTPAQFYDQLSRLAQQINNGAKTIPNMSVGEKQTIRDGVKKFADLAKAAPTGPTPSGAAVSLAAAMALPINKGKSADEVKADILKHGHQVKE